MKNMLSVIGTILFCACAGAQPAPAPESGADKLGWNLAVHAYTFRKFTIFEAIDKTAALGIKHMSISGGVILSGTNSFRTTELSAKDAEAIRKRAEDAWLKLVNIGVVKLSENEAQSRKVFEFAKRMGVDTLVSEPAEKALDTVDKLCKEYNIKVAIHNHPKPSHYWNPDTVLAALKGRSHLLGACADTGHWIRSGLDPLESLKKMEGRIICLHFKDLAEKAPKTHDVPWGTGVANARALMAELKRQGFRGDFCVEYEHNWENSMPEVAQCAKFFYTTANELAQAR